jgi:hypothetical protein
MSSPASPPSGPAPAFPEITHLKCRRFRPQDLPTLLELSTHCVPCESRATLIRHFGLNADPAAWSAWFILADGALAGFVAFRVRERDACIRFLSLHPMLRNPGYFRRLLAFVAAQSQREPSVLLRERDLSPQIFLRTLGYRCVSTHKRFFRPQDSEAPHWPDEPQDAWLFRPGPEIELACGVLASDPEPAPVLAAHAPLA